MPDYTGDTIVLPVEEYHAILAKADAADKRWQVRVKNQSEIIGNANTLLQEARQQLNGMQQLTALLFEECMKQTGQDGIQFTAEEVREVDFRNLVIYFNEADQMFYIIRKDNGDG